MKKSEKADTNKEIPKGPVKTPVTVLFYVDKSGQYELISIHPENGHQKSGKTGKAISADDVTLCQQEYLWKLIGTMIKGLNGIYLWIGNMYDVEPNVDSRFRGGRVRKLMVTHNGKKYL